MDLRLIHDTNLEALAQYIAMDFAKHLRPQARQMPMFTADDYVVLKPLPDIAWRGDVYVDDDYIFGAHVVVTHRKNPLEAINSNMESLFIQRSSTQDRAEYITTWYANEEQFKYCRGDWYRDARSMFMDWYGYVCQNDKVPEQFDRQVHDQRMLDWYRHRQPQPQQFRQFSETLNWIQKDFKFKDINPS